MHDRLGWTSSTGTLVTNVNNDTIAERRLVGFDTNSRIFPPVFAYNPARSEFTRFRNPWKILSSLFFPFFPSRNGTISVSWASSNVPSDLVVEWSLNSNGIDSKRFAEDRLAWKHRKQRKYDNEAEYESSGEQEGTARSRTQPSTGEANRWAVPTVYGQWRITRVFYPGQQVWAGPVT